MSYSLTPSPPLTRCLLSRREPHQDLDGISKTDRRKSASLPEKGNILPGLLSPTLVPTTV